LQASKTVIVIREATMQSDNIATKQYLHLTIKTLGGLLGA